ncbi:hypothetical protein [Bacillus cereus]|uniref:hypothetical protein n=1 Tax=Bacillus cereus TaxID=1396 RepID=UPI000BF316C6|nr:hypothetical protein [Bacillus cereus]PFD44777.1 hypothetical protein CN281_19155 [Bacillus cereus]PFH89280.1 hypothetical protein COI78_24070 [Bacillus cereus]
MGKDATFKKNFRIKGMEIQENMYMGEFYNPDLILKDSNNMVILEHSSTGDRKVHIGELTQFIEYVINSEDANKHSLIIFLDGKSVSPPKEKQEQARLKFYIDRLFLLEAELLKKIFFIGVVKFEEKNLNNLSLNDLKGKCKIIYSE